MHVEGVDADMVVREVNGIIVLTPDAGKVLRRVDADPAESGASEVWLAPADSRDDWEDVDPGVGNLNG